MYSHHLNLKLLICYWLQFLALMMKVLKVDREGIYNPFRALTLECKMCIARQRGCCCGGLPLSAQGGGYKEQVTPQISESQAEIRPE